MASGDNTLLLHIDDRHWTGDEVAAPFVEQYDWYLGWLRESTDHLFLLVPHSVPDDARARGDVGVIRLADDGACELPQRDTNGLLWLLNGACLPMIHWDEAEAAVRQSNGDILVFDPVGRTSTSHYHESVLVGPGGEVLRLQRHYDDSPLFVDHWFGEASMLVVSHRRASTVVSHVARRGWGLDSIGGLTRRFKVEWSETAVAPVSEHPPSILLGPMNVERSIGERSPAVGREIRPPQPSLRCAVPTGTDHDGGEQPPSSPAVVATFYPVVKRALDLVVACLGLLLLAPVMIAVAVVIKLTSRGPVFFAHKRQGIGGKEFRCLKFRSMRADADEMQAALRATNEVDGPQFKITNDPRHTRLGAFLRATNIDELPQLINVLLGQMSLVGPRPSPDQENRLCPAWRRTRLSLRPGITGLWQVMRRRATADSDFQEWIYYDAEYAKHRSLWLDLQILWYTPFSILLPGSRAAIARALERRGICPDSKEFAQLVDDVAPPSTPGTPAHAAPPADDTGAEPLSIMQEAETG